MSTAPAGSGGRSRRSASRLRAGLQAFALLVVLSLAVAAASLWRFVEDLGPLDL